MTIGSCEFLDRLREIVGECEGDPDRVVGAVREEFGGFRVYVLAPVDGKRDEGVRLLRDGTDPERVAAILRVHVSTVYRWRRTARQKRSGSGLGRPDWVL